MQFLYLAEKWIVEEMKFQELLHWRAYHVPTMVNFLYLLLHSAITLYKFKKKFVFLPHVKYFTFEIQLSSIFPSII